MTNEEFKAARKAAGLTQAQAAQRAGVTISTVAKWESGMHRIPSDAAEAILAAKKMGRAANLKLRERATDQ